MPDHDRDRHRRYSERAVRLLDAEAPKCAEFHFFSEVKGKPYFIMNVLVSADILDEEKSECTSTKIGEIVTIVSHLFDAQRAISTPPIFKLPGRFYSSTFVTNAVPEMVVREKLSGFQFRDPRHDPMRDLFLGKDVNAFPGLIPQNARRPPGIDMRIETFLREKAADDQIERISST